jgi:hypothetical protein
VSKLRRVVVVSDIHVGSASGILPADYIDSSGITVPLNTGQRYLWDCWVDFCKRAKRFVPDAIIINGDVVEGVQRKECGAGLSLRMMVDQKNAAIRVLSMLRDSAPKSCALYMTQGTAYHVGENGEMEEDIAAHIGARRYYSVGGGQLVREVLWLDIGGVIIEAAHAIGGNSGFYRTTALDRELQWSALSGKDESKGVPKSDLIVRSHVHFFMAAEHASKQGVIVPCWQLQTHYARKSSVHRLPPDIGGVFVHVDPDAKKRGEPACRILKQLYDLPPVPVTKL